MNIVVFSPYGNFSKETGFIYLFSRFLKTQGQKVSALQCDGAFSLCGRDKERNWSRSLDTCLMCEAEQNFSASWAGIESTSLSKHLTKDEVKLTKEWIDAVADDALASSKYNSEDLSTYVNQTFSNRFSNQKFDSANTSQNYFYRKTLLSAARMNHIAKSIVNNKFNSFIIADSHDYMSEVLKSAALKAKKTVVTIGWDEKENKMKIINLLNSSKMESELLVDNVISHRRETSSWPEMILKTFSDLNTFLGIDSSQMSLPL